MSSNPFSSSAVIGTTSASAVAVPRRSDVVFGRERELAALTQAFEASGSAQGCTVLLAGDAGYGKSALLAAFVRQLRGRAIVAPSECFAIESSLPFGPFRRVFERLAARGQSGTEAQRVIDLLDTIRDRDAAPAERSRIAATAGRALASVASRETLVLTIDDLHWADSASVELFAYLARSLADEPIMFIATMRSREIGGTVLRTTSELRRRATVVDLSVGPLSAEDTAAITRQILALDRSADREFVADLHRRANGSPLLIEEILGALVDRRLVFVRDGAWYRSEPLWDEMTPPSVASTVAERLGSMDAATADILRAAAVLGQRFSFEALAALTRAPRDAVIAAVKVGITSQLIEAETTGRHATYRFHHALLRDGVEASLLAPERATLHASAAEVLGQQASPAELAHHYDVAGDRLRALPLHMRAALDAQRGFAIGDAISHAEHVLELAPRDGSLGPFFVQLLPASLNLPDATRAIRFVERVRDFYRDTGDQMHYGRALAWLGVLRGTLVGSDIDEYVASQRAALEVLEPLGDSVHLVNALANLGPFTDNAEALALAERALAVADRVGVPREQVRGHECCGWALLRVGRVREALAHVEQILALTRTQKFAGPAAYATFMARVIRTLSQVEGTDGQRRALAREAIQWAQEHEVRAFLVVELELQSAQEQGDWDAALRLCDELSSMENGTQAAASISVRTAWLQVMRQGPSWDEKREIARVFADCIAMAPWRIVAPQWAPAIATALEDPARVLELAEPFRQRLDRSETNVVGIYALAAARDLGNWATFAAWRDAVPTMVVEDAPAARALRAFADAEDAIRTGHVDVGLSQLEECATLLTEFWAFDAARFVRLRRVEVLASQGEIALADAELRPLLAHWRAARATWYLEQLRGRFAPHGLDLSPTVTATEPAGRPHRALTAREYSVALLVADGFTNKDIAATLGVSVRTAESHVEQIRSKLGVHRRAQIAAWATARR